MAREHVVTIDDGERSERYTLTRMSHFQAHKTGQRINRDKFGGRGTVMTKTLKPANKREENREGI